MENEERRGDLRARFRAAAFRRVGADLGQAPGLIEDNEDLAAVLPGNAYYDANARRYIVAWRRYRCEYIPQMTATRSVPDGVAWGSYPTLASSVTSDAAQTHDVLVHSFTPSRFKGIIFLASPEMFTNDQGADHGQQMSALVSCRKDRFGGKDPHFFCTMPSQEIAPKASAAKQIKGESTPVTVRQWPMKHAEAPRLMDRSVTEVYE